MTTINTEEEYKKALDRIWVLWESKECTPEYTEFEELVDAVEKYEDIHYPM